MGYELSLIHTEVLDVNPLYGQDTYAGGFSKPTCGQLGQAAGCTIASDATSYNLADFIFGLPSSVNLGNNFVSNLRQQVHSLYVQDDWRVTPKLTLNLGLRWEFASPLVDRDNNWSDFNPATNTMTQATGGSWYNRALVNPDYKDFAPRLGFAYNFMPKMVLRGGYGISYDFFNRVGSAIEGINAPQALFGVFSQTIPAGGPVPSNFLTTVNSFSSGIANPNNFNPLVSNVDYIPANSPWPIIQNWFLSIQREIVKDTISKSPTTEIIANTCRSSPIIIRPRRTWQVERSVTNSARPCQPTVQSPGSMRAGTSHYNGLSARVEHRFGHGLYLLNSFTWGRAIGDSEQALEYYAGYVEANPQNIHNLGAEAGPSSFDVQFNNVTSVVYQVPFGKGRKYGSNWNPAIDAVLGGWELNTINTAHTGTPLNVYYTPATAYATSGLSNDYRGEPFLRPNVTGSSVSQSKSQLINTYFAGYTFGVPPSARTRSAIWDATPSVRRV